MSLHMRPGHRWRPPSSACPAWFVATSACESFGDDIARSLLPIVAVGTLGAGSGWSGILSGLGLAASLLLSLPIGVVADRLSRPAALMSVSSLTRAMTVVGLLLLWRAGLLVGQGGIWALVLVAIVVGVADVVFQAGRGILVPRLVPEDGIRTLYGRVQSISQTGSLCASVVLPMVLAVTDAPGAWTLAALAYLASVSTQRFFASADRDHIVGRERVSPWRQAREGIGHVLAVPALKWITGANALVNATTAAANTLLPVIALTMFSVSQATVASVAVPGAIAGIVGGLVAIPATKRVGLRVVRVGTALGTLGSTALILVAVLVPGLSARKFVVVAGLNYAVSGFCSAMAQVSGSDLVPRLTPRSELATVSGAQRTVVLGIMPVAAVLFGAIGEIAGMETAVGAWVVLSAVIVIPSLMVREPDPVP